MVLLSAISSFIGYQIYRFKTRKKRVIPNLTSRQERAKLYPHPYPNGWFNIGRSTDLKAGHLKEVNAFGLKLVAFRGENEKVAVLDVYCPHLQANLAKGKVVGNNIQCPFHAWEFNGLGKCEKIPYNDIIPKNAKLKSWQVVECWGLILIWYNEQGDPPKWYPNQYLPELDEYRYRGKKSDKLYIHLQDFAENGADYAHFNYVHDLLTIPFSSRFLKLKHAVEICFGEGENKHLAWFTDKVKLVWKKSGKVIEQGGGEALVRYFGPGFLIFKFNSRIAKNVMLLKCFTPTGPLELEMNDYVYAPKGTSRLAIRYILREAHTQFKDDIIIWEQKGYSQKPVIVKGDGPIMKMRKWYKQFYE